MPYERRGKCVVKKNTGKKVGCSTSIPKAKKYLKKLHMVTGESFTNTVNSYLKSFLTEENTIINEVKQRLDKKCWKGYRKQGTKVKGGVRVNNCVKIKK